MRLSFDERILSAALLVFLLISCSPLREETRTELDLLGTTCTLTVYAANPDPVLDDAFARIREIDWLMKYTGPESDVAAVNRAATGEGVLVGDSTLAVVKRGLYFSAIRKGRFDISIGPLVELWGIGKDVQGEVPPDEAIAEALALVDYREVEVDGNRVSLNRSGMAIDLGGIAKGYAADEVARIFREAGVEHALINLGGNVLAFGSKPDGSPWRIGVQDPASNRGAYIGVLRVTDRAVVTSGPYERFFFQDGKRYHHILDTSTGYPVENGLTSVTIVAESSMDADALSTLVFTLGPERGIALIEEFPEVEAMVVTVENLLYSSSGMAAEFSLNGDEYRFAP